MEFTFAVGWIEKLGKALVSIRNSRKDAISHIADELFVQPSELGRLFIEPDLQPFNPADDYDQDEPDELFRVPFYRS